MDIPSPPFGFTSHSVLASIPFIALEEGVTLEVDDLSDDYDEHWDDGGSCAGSWCSGYWRAEREHQVQVQWAESNPVFDFYGMKQRRASRHAVERSRTVLARSVLARRRRITKGAFTLAGPHEPIGSRNDIWREDIEKGALTTYNRRRCRCDYCMQLATLAQERRALRWALRRAEQGKYWEEGKFTTNKKPQYVRCDCDVENGDAGDIWDRVGGAFEPGTVPPMEVNLLDLVRIRGPQPRRAVQARLSLHSGIANRGGTKGSLSPTESNLSIESTSGSEPLPHDPDWEVLSVYSEWDRCSVQSL